MKTPNIYFWSFLGPVIFFWRETKEVPFFSEQSKKRSNPINESRGFASKVNAQLMRAMMLSLQSQGFLPFCILRGQKGIFCR